MITLNTDRMRKASNNVFTKRLNSYHESLINDPKYKHILDRVTFHKFDNGLTVFKSSYIEALAHISEELSSDYICDLIFNSSDYCNNSMCSNGLYWNVAKIDDTNSILDRLYIHLLLSRVTDYGKGMTIMPKMTIYENYIHIGCGVETGFVSLAHAGKKIASNISVLGFSITNDKEICILSNPITNKQVDKTKFGAFVIKDLIVLADATNGEIHMINIEEYRKYSKEHPFIEIKEEYR